MPHNLPTLADLDQAGCALLPQVFALGECERLLMEWHVAQSTAPPEETMRLDSGELFAARDLLGWCPAAAQWANNSNLLPVIQQVLGERAGLVRILFFDKPPQRSWNLPWHRDTTIAVKEHRPSARFRNPTVKSGVPHVEAPTEVLNRMISARLHLDPVDDENGPLLVQLGSHQREVAETPQEIRTIHAGAGDVFLMRPLLLHSSKRSVEGTARHRRILHLEFAADAEPGDGLQWRQFHPVARM